MTLTITTPEEVGLSSRALARIDTFLEEQYLAPQKIAGALTLVARRGKIAFLSPLGRMDRERDEPMRVDTIVRIYSMTKPITSVALMQLHERALFQLSDPVHKWIPAFEHLRVYRQGRHPAFVTDAAQRPMTVRDLLTHQSGLTYGIMSRTGLDSAYRKLKILTEPTLAAFIEKLATLPLEFSPGTAWNYSVATDVLGYLVERMSGEPLDTYFHKHIFEPLGMVDTAFSVPADKLERFAASYMRGSDGRLQLLDDPRKSPWAGPTTLFSGGGGLVSTAHDYLRFAEMLRRGGTLDGARILGPRTVELMARNHLTNGSDLGKAAVALPGDIRAEGVGFGLGLAVVLDPARAQTPSNAGELSWGGMASTAFWVDPREELTVVFLTQLVPSSTYDFRGPLRSLVYGAIDV